MELTEAIYGRRSVRRFIKKDIEPEKLRKIISAGTFAPSACNIQGWKFIVVDNQRLKERLVNKGTIEFIKFAPIGILVLYDNVSGNPDYEDYIQSASAAIQNMILTSHSLGIGSCWICHLPSKKSLRKLFHIPSCYDPIAYVALGYYKKLPNPLPRKHGFNDIVSFNKFNFSKKTNKKTIILRSSKRQLFRLYKLLPFKKLFLPITKKFEKFNADSK
ncbi:nitroreductase family protein [Candidatus Woesearchaeota archaeon]|nr:nitroreductase family protein [Candidatus Woesearchaeota archaeon]